MGDYDEYDLYGDSNDTVASNGTGISDCSTKNVATSALFIVLCIIGLIGNFIAIFVILVLREYRKSVTHLYVLQLAFADSIFLVSLPFKVAGDINSSWGESEGACKAKETILFLNYYAAILFLTIMSVDRYIAVCHTFSAALQQLRKQKSAIIIALSTWLAGFLLCVPVLLYTSRGGQYPKCTCTQIFPVNHTLFCTKEGFVSQRAIEMCLRNVEMTNYCTDPNEIGSGFFGSGGANSYYYDDNDHESSAEVYDQQVSDVGNYSYGDGGNLTQGDDITSSLYGHNTGKSAGWKAFVTYNFLVMFISPFMIMATCYGLIAYRLSSSRVRSVAVKASSVRRMSTTEGPRKRKKSISKSSHDRRRVTVMCAALVVSFVICWLPTHAIKIASVAGIDTSNDLCDIVPIIGTFMAYLNSALNPFLYSFLGTNFFRRWRSTRNTIKRSIRSRRRSSSSTLGSVRFSMKNVGKKERSMSNATSNTKLHRNPTGKFDHGSDSGNRTDDSHTLASKSDTQPLNPVSHTQTDRIVSDVHLSSGEVSLSPDGGGKEQESLNLC